MTDEAERPTRTGRRKAQAALVAAPRRAPANRFRRAAKMDEVTTVRLVYCFCNGIPLKPAARWTGVSAKTVRTVYIDMRRRLTQPKFNKWHGAYRRLLNLPSIEMEGLVRAAFIDTLAECGLNETCYRNYKLGNRKTRLCRACPLPKRFSSEERVRDALDVIDAVHAFYAMLGIRGEKEIDPLVLFRLRLIHTATVATASAAESKMQVGQRDLAVGGIRTRDSRDALLDTMLADLSM